MNEIILDKIRFSIEIQSLAKTANLKHNSKAFYDLKRLVNEALKIGKPKAIYKVLFIEDRTEDSISVDGIVLKSRVLSVNLNKTYRVFPFVATSGRELGIWANSIDDMLRQYWADMLNEHALRLAINAVTENLSKKYRLGEVSIMSPGSIEDWPIEEQRELFSIFGDTGNSIGVDLTENCLMIPLKSISGIVFPAEERFESCKLCSRENCPVRRVPYDSALFERKYKFKN